MASTPTAFQPNPKNLSWGFSAALYAVLAFAAFWPCLLLGRAYFENDLLTQYGPFRAFLKDQLARGHFPLWNPDLFCGQPFFADPNAMMTYPLNYPTLLFSVPYGLSIFYFLHFFLAAGSAHFWLRSLRLSESASRVGALTFALSGFFWWELIHPPILAALAWFPCLMGCLENLSKNLSPRWAFLSGLCFAMIFCCGNFQSTSCILYTALAYFAFRLLAGSETESSAPVLSRLPWKKMALVFLLALWGSLPLFFHLIPAYEFSQASNRGGPGQTYENFNAQTSLNPKSTYEFLLPALGVPRGANWSDAIQSMADSPHQGNDFLGGFGYLGIWAPLLFFWAFKRKEKKFLYFLAGLALLSVFTAWGRYFPLHRFFCEILPGIDLSRAPLRFIQTYVLFGSLLAAYGYQALEKQFQEKERSADWIFTGVIYAALLLVVCLFQFDRTWREALGLILGASGLILWGRTDPLRKAGRWLFQAALLLPLLFSGWAGLNLGPASNYDYLGRFPDFSYLKEQEQGGRYYFDSGLVYPVQMKNRDYLWNFPKDAPMAAGIRMSNGYNPLDLRKIDEMGNVPLKTLVQLMDIQGLVYPKPLQDSPDFSRQAVGSIQLYQPVKTPVLVTAPARFQVLPEPGVDIEALSKEGFDPSQEAVLNAPLPPEVLSQLSPSPAKLKYELVQSETDRQVFKIHLDQNHFLVFSEVLFTGWKAWVDGKPAPLYAANHAFRALVAPSGNHEVEFRFEPVWSKPLVLGGILWFLLSGILAFLLGRPKTTAGKV